VRVLVVGGGAREHALCRSLASDGSVGELVVAPGNAGIAAEAETVPVRPDDVPGLVDLAEARDIDLVVVGPEAPLVAGLADALAERGRPVFGPFATAARLEGSKAWARDLCQRHGIPSPASGTFLEPGAAFAFLDELESPYVVKADGLASGKGVVLAEGLDEAQRAVEDCLVRDAFGEAGRRVVIEEFLRGEEVSAMALCDGRSVVPLPLARDHKRAHEGDHGPNTGGMGAASPVPSVDARTEAAIRERVLEPVAGALREEGIEYRGVVFAGLMLTESGPKVLEFNCRFGDPEAEAVLPRLTSGLGEAMAGCARGELDRRALRWSDEACVSVVLASEGYPDGPLRTGVPIEGIEQAEAMPGVAVFHGGTTASEGRVLTSGGRVLAVTATGADLSEARSRAYEACALISFDGMWYRTDIAAMREGDR
jgi:phosphoribosylamine--glycine ligase